MNQRLFEVKVISSFAAAHNLKDFRGKCENLHGHNWKVEVVLRGKSLEANGILIDFSEVKAATREALEEVDHKYLNELKPFDVLNPSAENIARHIYEQTAKQMHATPNGAAISSITVWESDLTAATYRP